MTVEQGDDTKKEVQVRGRIPMSVRKQIKKAQKKSRSRKTLKNKRIKKIKSPVIRTIQKKIPNGIKHKKGILQTGNGRHKNKTQKKVRFNLESEGIQVGKFPPIHRVKMKTSKVRYADNVVSNDIRQKNRTLKKRGFKIRFTDDDIENKHQSVEHDGQEFKGNLLENLKGVKDTMVEGVDISRV
jgi:hypothetical protein